jgi:hypothetical protein
MKDQSVNTKEATRKLVYPLVITALSVLSFARLFSVNWLFYDDTAWLISTYSTGNLLEFLETGFLELRRPLFGVFLYLFNGIHKSTQYVYAIWDLMQLSTQILSALFLYFLIHNISRGKSLLSFLIAACFVITPIDSTLPYHANITYRLGVMLSIISFYFTSMAVDKGPVNWRLLVLALAVSATSHYVMLESTITYEPARFLLLVFVLSRSGKPDGKVIRKALLLCIPFLLLCFPLVLFKLTFNTYGMYADKYTMDLHNYLDLGNYALILLSLFFFQWVMFSYFIGSAGPWPFVLGISAFALCIVMFKRLVSDERNRATHTICEPGGEREPIWRLLAFGLALLVFPALMYLSVGKAAFLWEKSRHGIILSFGHAVMVGSVLYWICARIPRHPARTGTFRVFLSLLISAGVMFHNVNIDFYGNLMDYEKGFWRAFIDRFPTLPEDASFIIVTASPAPYYERMTMFYFYQFEFPLNLLYATSTRPEEFRRKFVFRDRTVQAMLSTGARKMDVRTYYGTDVYDLDKAIVVLYDGSDLFVNREILGREVITKRVRWGFLRDLFTNRGIIQAYTKTLPRELVNKDFPQLPPPVKEYPLRHRFELF